jgi:hypothetical protein
LVEGQQGERRLRAARAELLPPAGAIRGGTERCERRLRPEVGNHDHALDGGELCERLRHRLERIELLAGVVIAVGGEQHLGGNLSEAIEHSGHAEVR